MLQIFRPALPAAVGVYVLLGKVLTLGAVPPLPTLGLGFAYGFLLSGSALITNDYFDLEIDRINVPQRPMPANILIPSELMVLGLVAALLGLAAAAAFGPLALGLTCGSLTKLRISPAMQWTPGATTSAPRAGTSVWPAPGLGPRSGGPRPARRLCDQYVDRIADPALRSSFLDHVARYPELAGVGAQTHSPD